MMSHKLRSTTIITSAAFVNQEIAAEYGALPPSFLPIGHERLYALQVARAVALQGRIILTLPESFEPSGWDLGILRGYGVELLPIPDGLSLGESVLYALTMSGTTDQVRILHGDTAFLEDLPTETDLVSIASTQTSYPWGYVEADGRFAESGRMGTHGRPVLTGFFALSSGADFARALTLTRGNFLLALNAYGTSSAPLSLREVGGWMDCGHLQTYYRARAQITTERAFNSLKIDHRTVKKFSAANEKKVRMEAEWFERLPPPLRLHAPLYLGAETTENGVFSYRLAYEFSPTLHELFVFGRLGLPTWRQILGSAFAFLRECLHLGHQKQPLNALDALVVRKTPDRLDAFAHASGVDLNAEWRYAGRRLPSLTRIAEISAGMIDREAPNTDCIMHGDFCFPNMFYDFRQQIVKVIDPRGSITGHEPTIYGDVRYDLAKLNHSIEGYDLILANRYVLEKGGEREVTITFPEEGPTRWLARSAAEFPVAGRRMADPEIQALTVHLFLSMLPLHVDRPDRQHALLANALRLFVALSP
ncbi:hypothetical protein [Methylobacterium oxalidis]|uniref:hypothetical protein n=1 Tax=Methylobacterium oxalidis TaxID=944322 RepID=UPI0033148DB7